MTNAAVRFTPWALGALWLAAIPMAIFGWVDWTVLAIGVVPFGLAFALSLKVHCRFCGHHPLRRVAEILTGRAPKKRKALPYGGAWNDVLGDRCSKCGGYWNVQKFGPEA